MEEMTLSEALREASRLEGRLKRLEAGKAKAVARVESSWDEKIAEIEVELQEFRASARKLFEG